MYSESKSSNTQYTNIKDVKEFYKIKFYSILMETSYKLNDELTLEPKNKSKILSFPQWKKRVDCLLSYYDILEEENGRKVIAYKNANKNLHHWLKIFTTKIDKEGEKGCMRRKQRKQQ